MTVENYKAEFTAKALENGYSAENISKCLYYAKPLLEKNLPIIYNISHLSALVGYNQSYIERAIVFTHYFYRKFEIPKSNGKTRKISEPLPSLKDIQIWILKNILYKINPSVYAKAYIPGLTLKQNLVFHKDQPIVLTIDIKDFFSSIKRILVQDLFRSFGYSTLLSDLLSKICTLNNKLPQGAPTSPYISNLILTSFDEIISNHCLKEKIRYTRYADDLTFSGNFNIRKIIALVKQELRILSLEINEEKIHVMKQGTRQTVTGVVVNQKLQVSRVKRMNIRQAIYFINKFGLPAHLEKINSKKSNYIDHLLGQVLFVLFINPADEEFLRYKEFLNKLKSAQF